MSRSFADAVSASFSYFRNHRKIPVLTAAIVTVGCAAFFWGVPRREDISALLPDEPDAAAEQFRLLQKSPLGRKLTIHLRAAPELSDASAAELLGAAADQLAAALPPNLFSRVVAGPDMAAGPNLIPAMVEALPRLADAEDLREVEKRLGREEVRRRVREAYGILLSPAGIAMKEILREDPLGFRDIALRKLRHVNVLGNLQVGSGHFLSRDGRSAVLFAETPVEITDSAGAEALLAAFRSEVSKLPPGVTGDLIGAHRYTLANAATIKGDLRVILVFSSAAILLLFLVFLRGLGALWVFALPFGALAVAGAVTGAYFGKLNGVTLGFGGVLLGMSVDYGVYVYYAYHAGGSDPASSLRRLAGPLLFAALTTIGGFAVLFISTLPGQRELALFAISGLLFALCGAVFVLPHLLGPPTGRLPTWRGIPSLAFTGKTRRGAVVLWLLCMAFFAYHATGIRFAGDLKRLGVVPEELRAAEAGLAEVLGDPTGKALAFASGETLDEALRRNEVLFAEASGGLPNPGIVSIAPLLPSAGVQDENLRRWRAFWTPERIAGLGEELRDAGKPLGFSENAFSPFLQSLAADPERITPETYRRAGLGDLVGTMLYEEEGRTTLVTLLRDGPELLDFRRDSAAKLEGIRLVSPSGLSALLGEAIRSDFVRFLLLASLIVVVLTAWLLRSLRNTLAALVPAAASMVALMGTAGWLNIEFDLFNIVGAVLLSGITVDYGIFMASRDDGAADVHTDRAVTLAALNTMAGVGGLILAKHPALHSLGLTVFVGVAVALPTALWITPLLKERPATTSSPTPARGDE